MHVRLSARLLLLPALAHAIAGCGSDTGIHSALAPGSRIVAFGDSLTYGTGAEHQPALVILIHGENDTLRRVAQTATAHNIEQMVDMARAHGAAVVMFAVPGATITLSPPDYYEEIAERRGVPIDLDTLPTLRSVCSVRVGRCRPQSVSERRDCDARLAICRNGQQQCERGAVAACVHRDVAAMCMHDAMRHR